MNYKIKNITISDSALKLYNVEFEDGSTKLMSRAELADYIKQTNLKNFKDKKIKQ